MAKLRLSLVLEVSEKDAAEQLKNEMKGLNFPFDLKEYPEIESVFVESVEEVKGDVK